MAALSSRALALALLAVACTRPHASDPLSSRSRSGSDVTLFRDVAVVRQRVSVEAKDTRPQTISVELPVGVAADEITVLSHGSLVVHAVHAPTTPGGELVTGLDGEEPRPKANDAPKPTIVRIDVAAPAPGTYALELSYLTSQLHWDVAYTLTAAASRDRAELRGALAIRNETGIVLHAASARLVDADFAAWRAKNAEDTAVTLVGGTHSSTRLAEPHELGALDLVDGETRVDLVRDSTRRMRSVLVFDPIGTKLDNPQGAPLVDAQLGVVPRPSTRVTESFEIARDERGTRGLPGGPVRLLERKASGAYAVLGEARIFDESTRVSAVDTIAIGTADEVTATRERRELTIDQDGKRLVEEFVITVDNKRAFPVEILLREHLYRGQNWHLAFHSALHASKDGSQQISLRTRVPARSKTNVMYVVVYTWSS